MAKGLTDRLAGTKLGGVFFKTDEDEAIVEQERPVEQVAQHRPMPTVFSSAGETVSVSPSHFSSPVFTNVDPDIRAKVQAIADAADQKSFTKLRELIQHMSSSFPDEASCYKAAIAAAKAFNLSRDEFLRGVDMILSELTQAEQKMKTAIPQRIATKVGARREKIVQIQRTATAKQEEMTRLQEAVTRLNGEIRQLSQAEQVEQAAISQDEQSIREDAEKFSVALEAVRAPYITERQKIELYGKGV